MERQERQVCDEESGHVNVPLEEPPPQHTDIAQVTHVAYEIYHESVPPVQATEFLWLRLIPQLLLQLSCLVDVVAVRFQVDQLFSAIFLAVNVAWNAGQHFGEEEEGGCCDEWHKRPETAQHGVGHFLEIILRRFVHDWSDHVMEHLLQALHCPVVGVGAEIVLVFDAQQVAQNSPHVNDGVQVLRFDFHA